MSDLSDTQRSPSCGVNDKGYEWEPSTGSCYKYHPIIKSWRRARDICLHEGGQLAIINSVTESLVLKNIYLKNQIYRPPHMDPNHAFIGFRKSNDGNWVTVNGQSLAEAGFDRWAPGEPNNYNGAEECGSIRVGLLNDWPCSKHPLPCICEITP
ncbi:hemolymph lipopolysaccharide-binding protein-like [Leguminivora glycinivorella]|uniref:hemolymph lipopolysaccharide-binding protein-like n=1 Tax=Leguminivora glycinivorella TaxID=1035111 RepID=UPI0020101FD1|nr:hemolymph lipopolysaccharide-binding protein-like [Leguminivora glycinivorella]